MATIKSYTDIEQSKKLAEILPLESADMYYCMWDRPVAYFGSYKRANFINGDNNAIPCWSLAALLGTTSTYCNRLEITLRADKKYNVFAVKDDFVFRSFDDHPDGFDNLVDVCVVMIEKLHELKIL